ncbi:MAG: nuclear transport factor 2 family protein [Gammaproteobacteria bacterium]|nr:nuclear transport factor 2 family protein [Gammaproteobacteria bacterium]
MGKRKQTLQDLLDREAIRDLPLRYCDCVWRDDIPALVKLFAGDGEFVIRIGEQETSAKGHAALLEFYAQGLGIAPRPFIHNHVIDFDGGRKATGRCYLDLRSGKENMRFMGAGHYADTYVKEKGEWKFLRRHFTALRIDEDPTATTAAPVRKPRASAAGKRRAATRPAPSANKVRKKTTS